MEKEVKDYLVKCAMQDLATAAGKASQLGIEIKASVQLIANAYAMTQGKILRPSQGDVIKAGKVGKH